MNPFDVIVVGTSQGGLAALKTLLQKIPDDFAIPIIVVQHRQIEMNERLVGLLQKYTVLKVYEAEDKMELLSGSIYIAPMDYHLLLEADSLALSIEAPVNLSRPSIDVSFESAAISHRERTLAVILTGANKDGAAGGAAIENAGGTVIAQDPATADSPVMPEAVIASTSKAIVLPLGEIAEKIINLCKGANFA